MAMAIAATETPAKWAGIVKKMKQFAGDGRTDRLQITEPSDRRTARRWPQKTRGMPEELKKSTHRVLEERRQRRGYYGALLLLASPTTD